MSEIFEIGMEAIGRQPRLEDLVDVLECLQELCDRVFMQHVHGDIGYAVDLAVADAAFSAR